MKQSEYERLVKEIKEVCGKYNVGIEVGGYIIVKPLCDGFELAKPVERRVYLAHDDRGRVVIVDPENKND
jgi:hypothetical protein